MNTGEGASALPNLKAEFTFRRGAAMPFVQAAAPAAEVVGILGSLPVISLPDARMATSPDHAVAAWAAYCPGVAGMARDQDPDSANSQFFLMRAAYPTLEQRYTAWGKVVVGLDVVRAIQTGEPPPEPDHMSRVQVLADLPETARPKLYVIDVRGPAFGRLLAEVRQARGADFSVCDVDLPVIVR
jgi:peptidylprolyl isomerase